MRWERLFADLEAQAEAGAAAEFAGEVVERTRIETSRIRLVDRLRAHLNRPVRLHCLGGEVVAGQIERAGPDWLSVAESPGRSAVVPLAAVAGVSGLGGTATAPGSSGRVADRLDLRYALRGLARDRAAVLVTMTDGAGVAGTIDRVGADYVDLAEHPPGEVRRARAVRTVRAVPLAAVAIVRTG